MYICIHVFLQQDVMDHAEHPVTQRRGGTGLASVKIAEGAACQSLTLVKIKTLGIS